ncbi:hypothetical protein WR25_27032 [Diploscapter pachys]|uniref:Uncharacterized protein n=1 Tax=Diploscapter pachys TaxID=2018661 RepID=A0A2A2JNY9_9BILA|nr:hypothetical protein WR25_27032 [Diploscapter pachys]
MVMEKGAASMSKIPAAAAHATVSQCATASPMPDWNSLPGWSIGAKLGSFFSQLAGSPFAIAVGSGARAHSNGGGAVALSQGEGAQATAVSNGGYAEAVAIGTQAKSSATANSGEIAIERNEVKEDGSVKHDEFFNHI